MWFFLDSFGQENARYRTVNVGQQAMSLCAQTLRVGAYKDTREIDASYFPLLLSDESKRKQKHYQGAGERDDTKQKSKQPLPVRTFPLPPSR